MPASTRSAAKQAKLEDVGAGNKDAKPAAKSTNSSTAGHKRKADAAREDEKPKSARRAKPSPQTTADLNEPDGGKDDDVIVVNRAPVLELWSSSVAHFTNPSLPWSTCLSVGSAISTLAAISKGRSIGTISKPDPGDQKAKADMRRDQADKDQLHEVEVMSFHLRLKDGQALVGDKPKKAGEEALMKKFGGEEQYGKVRKCFEEGLEQWKDKEDELDGRAFSMYEDFRPSVKPGEAGWGRKGELSLSKVKSVIGES